MGCSDGGYVYLAVGHRGPYLYEDPDLWIFDTVKETWTNLGAFEIHPDPDWDCIKPGWNPWFYDSRHLAFFSGSALYVVSPYGKNRRKLVDATHAGLAIPSPDGSMVAFITSTPRSKKGRPDLSFWGGSSVWVTPSGGGKAVQIAKASDDETYDLRWLSNTSLIFDRIGDGLFNDSARIWTAPVAVK